MRQPHDNANYASITDFLTAVELPALNPANAKHHDEFMRGIHGANWYGAGCRSGLDVLKAMREGWPEGRARLDGLRSKIGEVDLAPIDRRRRPCRAEMGDVLDIHAVYAGRLETAWRTARRQAAFGPQQIDLCANMLCSGSDHADVLFWRGAAAAVLADILEQAGYMVRLTVIFGGNTYDSNNTTSCRIVVKDHGCPFDITSTSAVILPGFFRALGHAWIANHAKHKRTMGGIGVGQGVVEASEILLSHKVRDHGTALAFVNDTIAKVNEGRMGEAA